eukprot:m.180172 g.180172  ORF g.180172 m.180172 type:complete len:127 (+) comp18009_c0_seq3:75-455(+)
MDDDSHERKERSLPSMAARATIAAVPLANRVSGAKHRGQDPGQLPELSRALPLWPRKLVVKLKGIDMSMQIAPCVLTVEHHDVERLQQVVDQIVNNPDMKDYVALRRLPVVPTAPDCYVLFLEPYG